MIPVTRYLLVSRVENEANNDLRSLLLGSDSISGLYKSKQLTRVQSQTVIEDSLCCLGMMPAIKEGDSRPERRFPSQQNSMEPVKCP